VFINIVPGCITCGECEAICPEVFTILETSEANNEAVPGNEVACRAAAKACPVSVIQIEE
jgi:ferredoxin